MSTDSADVAKCKLKELYREACRLHPCLLALQIVDQSRGRRLGRGDLRQKLLREAKELNQYFQSASLSGAVKSESTAHYYLMTCVALGLLERLGDLSAGSDLALTPRAIVIALAQRIRENDEDWQLNPILRFFCTKLLWEVDRACFGGLVKLLKKNRSLPDLYSYFSNVYLSKEQFYHIMKPHLEWLVDLGLLERQGMQREATYVDCGSLRSRQTLRGMLSSHYDRIESSLVELFLRRNKLLPANQIDDYVKYAYTMLEKQGYQLAGEYVSVAALADVAQLLATLSGKFVLRKVVEKQIVDLMDANRDQVSSMEAMTEEIGLGSPIQYGPVRVSYLKFLDANILRPRRTPHELGIDGINTFLGG